MESNNKVVTKKSRIWNPAVDDNCSNLRSSDKTVPINFQGNYISQNNGSMMQPYPAAMPPDYSKAFQINNAAMSFRFNIMLLPNYLMNPNFTPINVPNQNCCAVCGSIFRLTADLVQHMRVNHRTNHYSHSRKRLSSRQI
uniref:C2H2-type domain-containing protein n=1 Tax=Setaria digitata TaxID=48799 RepID=A0A915Q377_9BILA